MLAGLDIGTTGSKISVFNNNGELLDSFYESYKISRNNNANELGANELINAVKALLRKACNKYTINSIGVDSFGEAFVMLDESDKPLTNIIIATDSRGEKEVNELINLVGEEKLKEITGLKANSIYSLPKIMWFKNYEPDLFSKCRHILLIEDFVIYSLTGNNYIDYTLATRSLAYDYKKNIFSKEILEKVGIDVSLFSKPVMIGTNCGTLKLNLKKELKIKNDVIFTVSGHDQVAVLLGSGVLNTLVATDGAGTVECITPVFDNKANFDALIEKNYAIVPYFGKNEFITYAYFYSSGSLIDWFVDTFVKDKNSMVFSNLEKGFKSSPSNLLVLPYWSGSGTPDMNIKIKGSIIGLNLETKLEDIYQGVLEGIAFEIKYNIDSLKECGVNIEKLVATGGGAKSKKWLQIKADILYLPIDVLSDNQSGARGSAIAAGLASGVFKNKEEGISLMVKVIDTIKPNKENHNLYKEIYNKYKIAYKASKEIYNE